MLVNESTILYSEIIISEQVDSATSLYHSAVVPYVQHALLMYYSPENSPPLYSLSIFLSACSVTVTMP